MSKSTIMQRLLIPLWLRPESALWYAHMLDAAQDFLKNVEHPAMEFGCMDGVNTFVLLGGEFDRSFDVFSDVSWSKVSHKKSTLSDDYFDTVAPTVPRNIIQKPHRGYFDIGLDWKKTHIVKAKRLNIFREFILCDLNKPLSMINTKTLQTIWAPNLYWVNNTLFYIHELHRILHVNGRLITIVPDVKQLEHSWYRFANNETRNWFQDLDRGRNENYQNAARCYDDWAAMFESSGFTISQHRQFLPSLVGKLYDIGFRPMFPVFMNIHEQLKRSISSEEFLDLKQHWINTMTYFMEPLCDESWMSHMEHLWHIFELKKKA